MKRIMCMQEQAAADFAEVMHALQKRSYTGDPYVVHTRAVADIVATVPGNTLEQRQAAHLHDAIEDPKVARLEIECRFGPVVAGYVVDLTDVTTHADGNRSKRKAIECARLARICPASQTIKLADLWHNSEDILRNDPGFARTYLPEKAALLEVLHRGDPGLWLQCFEVVNDALSQLQIAPRTNLQPIYAAQLLRCQPRAA